jgi:hypothetical protein
LFMSICNAHGWEQVGGRSLCLLPRGFFSEFSILVGIVKRFLHISIDGCELRQLTCQSSSNVRPYSYFEVQEWRPLTRLRKVLCVAAALR